MTESIIRVCGVPQEYDPIKDDDTPRGYTPRQGTTGWARNRDFDAEKLKSGEHPF